MSVTATATSRRAGPDAKALARRRALAEELVAIHRKLQGEFARMAEIETALKDIATDAGEAFKEFVGRDYVSVSGKIAAEFKGNVPVLQTRRGEAPARVP
jgi:hypothetical protein